MRTRTALLLSLGFLLIAAAPGELTHYLVKDIHPGVTPASSYPYFFARLGDTALFRVRRYDSTEIWRSNGSASGTYRLAANDDYDMQILAVTGDLCFFRTLEYANVWRYWATDGTAEGTLELGARDKIEGWWNQSPSAAWSPAQGVLYFATLDSLWRSDGTPGGTYTILSDLYRPGDLTSFRGSVYFSAGDQLWKSDGTAQGTVVVRNVPVSDLRAVGPRLVFRGWDDAHGFEIWASDGTTRGTRRISDLAKGEESPELFAFNVVGKHLYFVALASTATGKQLYVTDGTAQGTRRLTAFSDPKALDSYSQAALGDRNLFVARSPQSGMELWSTDGTPEGTRMVLDACPGSCSSSPGSLLQHQGRLYYQATDGTHGSELWVTDGTAQGTRRIEDLCPGSCGSSPMPLRSPGDPLFFTAEDVTGNGSRKLWITDGTAEGAIPLDVVISGQSSAPIDGTLIFSGFDPQHGHEPWISDGTIAGTSLLTDLADANTAGSFPSSLRPLGETVLFTAKDVDGPALWRSDGTEPGTIVLQRGLSSLSAATIVSGRMFFNAYSGDTYSLWTSDGTEAGTLRLTPAEVRSDGEILALSTAEPRLLFSASDPDHGTEPWVTDGAPEGTRRIADLQAGTDSSSPRCFTSFRRRAWFGAQSRLWKSDGTSAGTVALALKLEGACPLMTYGNKLLFTTLRRNQQVDLWATDGTVAHTETLVQLRERAIPGFVALRGRLWFLDRFHLYSTDGTKAGTRYELSLAEWSDADQIMSDGARIYVSFDLWDTDVDELWVTDGTEAGTRKLAELGFTGPWVSMGGHLYLVSSDRYGSTLYRTDGTPAGTRPVRPDGEPNHVTGLVRSGNHLIVFTGEGEVWQTDGTAAGTKRIDERLLVRGQIVKAGPRFFFPAQDPETGWELWAMRE